MSQIRLYVGVSEVGDSSPFSPQVAIVSLDDIFLARVKRLRKIVVDNDLSHAAVLDTPVWDFSHPGFETRFCELIVTPQNWYYTGFCSPDPDELSVRFESFPVEHDDMVQRLKAARKAKRDYIVRHCTEDELFCDGGLLGHVSDPPEGEDGPILKWPPA